MPLYLHLSIHGLLAILVGFWAAYYFGRPALMVLIAIAAGFFIDLDHVLEYLIFFRSFNLVDFLDSQQFIQSGKLFLYFHAWEWAWLSLLGAVIFYRRRLVRAILITIALSIFVHLVSDCLINELPPRFYSITYRWRHDFSAVKMIENPADIIHH